MLKRILVWFGLIKSAPLQPRYMREAWPSLYAILLRYRPDIIAEVEPFGRFPIGKVGAWLDRHFPRERRWGLESPAHIPDQLRDYLEHAK
jgi:hypothetical protein